MALDPFTMTLDELATFVRALEQRWKARAATIPDAERHAQQMATMRAIQARLEALMARLERMKERGDGP